MMHKATVIIPCYNAQDSIEKAVVSALRQTVPVEVIVVDDCSGDHSPAIVAALAQEEPRLTLVRQPVNAGPSAARNAALSRVVTPWVAGLDSDDYLLPTRIERLVAEAERLEVDFLADDLIRVRQGQAPEDGYRLWKDESVGVVDVDLARFVRENIVRYTGARREIGYLKPLMRTAFLRAHNLFFREDMRISEDYEFYARSLANGARWCIIDPAGYIAVDNDASLSKVYPTAAIRTLLHYDRALLKHPGLTASSRSALREHVDHVSTDYAWRTLIDGVRARHVPTMFHALVQPPAVAGKVLLRTAKHFLGLPLQPAEAGEARRTAGQTSGLTFT